MTTLHRAFATLLCAGFFPCASLAQGLSEAAVKAAFIYKFLAYVDWPSSTLPPNAPYVIGILGNDAVAAELERIVEGRTVNDHRIMVRRLRTGEPLQALQVLFIGRNAGSTREVLRGMQRQAVLTISDGDGGLDHGSIVSLVNADDRISFEVSLDAAGRAGLSISSRMLAVARRVVPRSGTT